MKKIEIALKFNADSFVNEVEKLSNQVRGDIERRIFMMDDTVGCTVSPSTKMNSIDIQGLIKIERQLAQYQFVKEIVVYDLFDEAMSLVLRGEVYWIMPHRIFDYFINELGKIQRQDLIELTPVYYGAERALELIYELSLSINYEDISPRMWKNLYLNEWQD